MWKHFWPVVIMITVAGGSIKYFTSKILRVIQWSYTIIVLFSCSLSIFPAIMQALLLDYTLWNKDTATSVFHLLHTLAFPLHVICNIRMSYALKEMCFLLDNLKIDQQRKLKLIISICNVLIFKYVTVQFAVSINWTYGLFEGYYMFLAPFYLALLVRFYCFGSVLALCAATASSCYFIQKSLNLKLGRIDRGHLSDTIEDCRMKYEQLVSIISNVNDLVHLPILLILLTNIFCLCCLFFVIMIGQAEIATWLLGVIDMLEITLICLSCSLVQCYVSTL